MAGDDLRIRADFRRCKTSRASRARTVAVCGSPSSTDISPNTTPGCEGTRPHVVLQDLRPRLDEEIEAVRPRALMDDKLAGIETAHLAFSKQLKY